MTDSVVYARYEAALSQLAASSLPKLNFGDDLSSDHERYLAEAIYNAYACASLCFLSCGAHAAQAVTQRHSHISA
jgi:hypothetical protein